MTMQVRLWLTGVAFTTVCGLVSVSASTLLEGDKDEQDAVKKIAAEVKKGNAAGAQKMSEGAAKKFEEVSDLMHLYRPRSKGGMGWGSKAGANPATDGLEKKIQEFAKGVSVTAAAQVESNLEAAYWLAAMTELTRAKTPTMDKAGGRTKKAWIVLTDDNREAIAAFTKAAQAKNGAAMAKAANKINSTCVSCHSKFKD